MKVDLSSIKRRLAQSATPWQIASVEIAELVTEIERLVPVAETADAWVQAYENMDGMYNAEQALLKAVKEYKEQG